MQRHFIRFGLRNASDGSHIDADYQLSQPFKLEQCLCGVSKVPVDPPDVKAGDQFDVGCELILNALFALPDAVVRAFFVVAQLGGKGGE